MNTIASVRSQGQQALSNQKKEDNARVLKGVILTIDKFVESLAERIEKPNKSGILGFGNPAPLKEGDTKFNSCLGAIKRFIGKGLNYRSAISTPQPAQYDKLQKLFDNLVGVSVLNDAYNEPRIDFIDRFRKLFLMIKDGGLKECEDYPRVKNLFVGTTTKEKDKFDYTALYQELDRVIQPIKNANERKQLDEALEMAMAISVLETKQSLPTPPTEISTEARFASMPKPTTAKPEIDEPVPNVTESDITSALSTTTAAPAAQAPLTADDKYKISKIARDLVSKPSVQSRRLTLDQINKMAENIYRKKFGKGRRKTYRKKKAARKTRKVRRV